MGGGGGKPPVGLEVSKPPQAATPAMPSKHMYSFTWRVTNDRYMAGHD